MKKLSLLLVLLLLLAAPVAHATDTAPTPIYTVEEFLAMEETGSYILMRTWTLRAWIGPVPASPASWTATATPF